MAERRYRAFMSYSRQDRRVAARLFRALDGYRTPRALRGRETRFGPIPKSLYPLFRDREELPAADSLTERLTTALRRSDHLIVLCSPASAGSLWVNKEIETFAAEHGPERIHAVIVDGAPPACFPPALTAAKPDALAADIRTDADGWKAGVQKLVASLLDVGLGELRDREAARARFRARLNGGLATVFAGLFVAAGLFAWQAVEARKAEANERLRAEDALTRSQAAVLLAIEGVSRVVAQVSDGVETGDVSTAVAGSLLAGAEATVDGVLALAPENDRLRAERAWLYILLARHHQRTGDLSRATDYAAQADALFADVPEEALLADLGALELRAVALRDRGDTLSAANKNREAFDAYERSIRYASHLAEIQGDAPGAEKELRLGMLALGSHLLRTGRRSAALGPLTFAATAAAEEIDRADGDARLDAMMARAEALHGLGVASAATLDQSALEHHRKSMLLRRDVVDERPTLATRDALAESLLAVSALSDPAQGIALAREAVALRRGLVDEDPGDLSRETTLAVALSQLASVRLADGDLAAATEAAESALTLARKAVETDPENVRWRGALSEAALARGSVAHAAQDGHAAHAAFSEAATVGIQTLGKDLGDWRSLELTVRATASMADLFTAFGIFDEARGAYETSLRFQERLRGFDSDNTLWSVGHARMMLQAARLEVRAAAPQAALPFYQRAIALLDEIAQTRPDLKQVASMRTQADTERSMLEAFLADSPPETID